MKIKESKSKINISGSSQWLEQAKWFVENKDWLDKSALIAIKILRTLREESISQKDLAESIGVSAQYVNKVVKGRENLTLETICKIEKALGVSLIEVPVVEISVIFSNERVTVGQAIRKSVTQLVGTERYDYDHFENYNQETSLEAA